METVCTVACGVMGCEDGTDVARRWWLRVVVMVHRVDTMREGGYLISLLMEAHRVRKEERRKELGI